MQPYSSQYGLALGRKFLQFGELGKDYIPSPDAPNTYKELIHEWQRVCSRVPGEARVPLRVYDGGSDTSIYGSPEANYAFRYFHDLVHCQLQTEFDIAGEIHTARVQEVMLGSLSAEEAWVFRIDTIGQSLYHTMTGEFVEDQAEFVQWVYMDVRCHSPLLAEEGLNELEILTKSVMAYTGHSMSNTYGQGRPQATFTLPAIECYTEDQRADAEDLLMDNNILKTDCTIAAAAFLLKEQY